MDWSTVVGLLGKVPNVIWSALVASGVTLLGVIISNRSNMRQLREQHLHDVRENSKERLTSARREIYLAAASELSHAMGHIGTIPTLNPRKDNLFSPLQNFNATSAKLQLIAEPETATLAADFTQRLVALYAGLVAKAQPMFDLQMEADLLGASCDKLEAELDRLLTQQRTLVESPAFNQAEFDTLSRSLEFQRQQYVEQSSARAAVLEKFIRVQKAYVSDLPEEVRPLLEAQVPLIARLRGELEVRTDERELRNRSESSVKAMHSMLDKFLKRDDVV